jgi:predicted CopG family antitoxin
VARTISVADDVFEWLKEEKGDRSYSELLREFRNTSRSDFSDVAGINSLGDVSFEEVEEVVEDSSKETMEDLDEELNR